METKYFLRVAEALHGTENLENVQSLYVSNDTADSCPALQRAMLRLVQDERLRREDEDDSENPRSIALPEFSTWPASDWLKAGVVVIEAAELAAMSGDPTLTDFSFRMLGWWFLQTGKQIAEATYPCDVSD